MKIAYIDIACLHNELMLYTGFLNRSKKDKYRSWK